MKKVVLGAFALLAVSSFSAQADQQLAMKYACGGCHMKDMAVMGPSLKDLSAKLKDADRDELVKFVKTGTTGDPKWGGKAMPPNGAPEADVRKILEWMLSH